MSISDYCNTHKTYFKSRHWLMTVKRFSAGKLYWHACPKLNMSISIFKCTSYKPSINTLAVLTDQEHGLSWIPWMAVIVHRECRYGFKIKPMNTIGGASINCFLNPIFGITVLSKRTTSTCFLNHNKRIGSNICTVSTSDTRLLINPNSFSS